jgi:hypothetical protein
MNKPHLALIIIIKLFLNFKKSNMQKSMYVQWKGQTLSLNRLRMSIMEIAPKVVREYKKIKRNLL